MEDWMKYAIWAGGILGAVALFRAEFKAAFTEFGSVLKARWVRIKALFGSVTGG